MFEQKNNIFYMYFNIQYIIKVWNDKIFEKDLLFVNIDKLRFSNNKLLMFVIDKTLIYKKVWKTFYIIIKQI